MELPGYNLRRPSECVRASAMHERYIRRYMELLNRFDILPACDDLIYLHTKDEFPPDYLDAVRGYSTLPPPGEHLNVERQQPEEWNEPEPLEEIGEEPQEDNGEEEAQEAEPPPRSPLENSPDLAEARAIEVTCNEMMNTAYQAMMDWVNLAVMVVPRTKRKKALQLLALHGLMTAYAHSSLILMMSQQFEMALHTLRRTNAIVARILEQGKELIPLNMHLQILLPLRARTLQLLQKHLQQCMKFCQKSSKKEDF